MKKKKEVGVMAVMSNCGKCDLIFNEKEKVIKCDLFCMKSFHLKCVSMLVKDFESVKQLKSSFHWFCDDCKVRLGVIIDNEGFDDKLRIQIENLVQIVKGLVSNNLDLSAKTSKVIEYNSKLCSMVESRSLASSDTTDKIEEVLKPVGINDSVGSLDFHGFDSLDVVQSRPTGLVHSSDANKHRLSAADFHLSDNSPVTAELENRVKQTKHEEKKLQSSSTSGKIPYADKVKFGKPKRSQVVIGSKSTEQSNSTALKSVGKLSWIFVSRLSPDVSKEAVSQYLTENGIAKSECEPIKTRFNHYASFKVGVSECYLEKVMNSEFWIEGTLVRKFIPKKVDGPLKTRVFLAKSQTSRIQ